MKKCTCGSRAMGVLRLPLVAELRNRSLLSLRNEDRIEAEAFAAARFVRNTAAQRAGAPKLFATWRERDELGSVTGLSSFARNARQRPQQPADFVTRGTAGRTHARTAVQPYDLDSRVLAEHPALWIADAPAELRLDAGILVVRRAILGRELLGAEQLDRPTGKQPLELARLVL